MAELVLHEIRYRVNVEPVAIAVRSNSPRSRERIDLQTTQAALTARAVADGRTIWTDADVIAEAQAQLTTTNDTLTVEGS